MSPKTTSSLQDEELSDKYPNLFWTPSNSMDSGRWCGTKQHSPKSTTINGVGAPYIKASLFLGYKLPKYYGSKLIFNFLG
jgi:hypothetical protein